MKIEITDFPNQKIKTIDIKMTLEDGNVVQSSNNSNGSSASNNTKSSSSDLDRPSKDIPREMLDGVF